MDLVIITGISGAGKATTARIFEDMSYRVVDNLLPSLLLELVDRMQKSEGLEHLAVVVDGRSGKAFTDVYDVIDRLRTDGTAVRILYLDASDASLIQRFKESRRHHPLDAAHTGVSEAIMSERALLEPMKCKSDWIVDTSHLGVHQLRREIQRLLGKDLDPKSSMAVNVISFGFKFGVPSDADLVFDVRFLINPHYESELRSLDGRHAVIDDYVMDDPDSAALLEKILDLLEFSLPRYLAEGKAYLTIGIGCTGGRHRSVVIARRIGNRLEELDYRVNVVHRDVDAPE